LVFVTKYRRGAFCADAPLSIIRQYVEQRRTLGC